MTRSLLGIFMAVCFSLCSTIKNDVVAYAATQLDRRVNIEEVGYLDIPSSLMELSTETNWNTTATFTVVQKGLEKFARVMVTPVKGAYGDYNELYDDYYVSDTELAILTEVYKQTIADTYVKIGTGQKIIDFYPVKRGKVNNMPVTVLYFTTKLNNNPYVLNWWYLFENKDRVIRLSIFYRHTEKLIWEPVMRDILKSFRITNVIK